MKKTLAIVLVVVLLLGGIGIVACTPKVSPPPSGEPTPAPPPSGGGSSWNDVPVYPGAKQIQKGMWMIPPAEEGDYSQVEWRYYEVGAGVSDVAAFYKSKMPASGWQEMAWMEMQNMNWGMYTKNNENDAAMVWTTAEEGKAVFALMRASR